MHPVRSRVNKISNRFSLSDVELAVQYSAAREFSRQGLTCSACDESFHEKRRGIRAAVTRQLYNILACKGIGPDESCNQHLIDHPVSLGAQRSTQACTSNLERPRLYDLRRNRKCLGPAHP